MTEPVESLSLPLGLTVPQVIHALSEAGGIPLAAAAKLGCDRATVLQCIDQSVDIQQALAEILRNNDDLAEVAFLQAVQNKEAWAVQLQMKRAAERRSDTRVRGQVPPGLTPRYGNGPGLQTWSHLMPRLIIPEDATPAEEAAIRRYRAGVMEQIIADIALNADRPETRAMAAAKLAERDVPPINRNINVNLGPEDVAQLDDADLDAELARLEGAARPPPAGEAPAGVPAPLSNLRH